MNRWQIGNIKITQVVEVEAMGGTRFILPQATPEAIQPIDWLIPHRHGRAPNYCRYLPRQR